MIGFAVVVARTKAAGGRLGGARVDVGRCALNRSVDQGADSVDGCCHV